MKRLFLVLLLLLSAAVLACDEEDDPGITPPSQPPVEGTIDPGGGGSTDPQTVRPNPFPVTSVGILTDVRTGAHPEQGGWDRIVFQFLDQLPEARISYQSNVTQCGSGFPVTTRGQAALVVTFTAANAHNDAGQSTVRAREITGPGNSIVEARGICDFEAEVTWVVGTTGRQRFKVTSLTNPTRLVIDVKW